MNTYNITLKLLVSKERMGWDSPIKKEGTTHIVWSYLPKKFRKIFPKLKDAYIVQLEIKE